MDFKMEFLVFFMNFSSYEKCLVVSEGVIFWIFYIPCEMNLYRLWFEYFIVNRLETWNSICIEIPGQLMTCLIAQHTIIISDTIIEYNGPFRWLHSSQFYRIHFKQNRQKKEPLLYMTFHHRFRFKREHSSIEMNEKKGKSCSYEKDEIAIKWESFFCVHILNVKQLWMYFVWFMNWGENFNVDCTLSWICGFLDVWNLMRKIW